MLNFAKQYHFTLGAGAGIKHLLHEGGPGRPGIDLYAVVLDRITPQGTAEFLERLRSLPIQIERREALWICQQVPGGVLVIAVPGGQ
jgi:hypothetical protein